MEEGGVKSANRIERAAAVVGGDADPNFVLSAELSELGLTIEDVEKDTGGVQVGRRTSVVPRVLPGGAVEHQRTHGGVRARPLHPDVLGAWLVVEDALAVVVPEDVRRLLQGLRYHAL